MGHDIVPVSNHKLNTKNIETLAIDLSKRLDFNILYGYFGNESFNKLLNLSHSEEFVILGEIHKEKSYETFVLYDPDHQKRGLVDKFGTKIFSNPAYWIFNNESIPDEDRIKDEIRSLEPKTFYFELVEGESYLNIYEQHLCNSLLYFSRWFTMSNIFTTNQTDNSVLEEFLDFRRNLKLYTELLGGDIMYYLDDQIDGNRIRHIGEDPGGVSWKDFKQIVVDEAKDLLIDIPRFFLDQLYKDEFMSKNKDPMAFIDDFRDF